MNGQLPPCTPVVLILLCVCVCARALPLAGAALAGGLGYLYIAQRAVFFKIASMVLKYPIMIVTMVLKQGWAMVIKPILRKLIALRGTSGAVGAAAAAAGVAGGELPGGTY